MSSNYDFTNWQERLAAAVKRHQRRMAAAERKVFAALEIARGCSANRSLDANAAWYDYDRAVDKLAKIEGYSPESIALLRSYSEA